MRWTALIAILGAIIWFGAIDNDWLDRRPVQRVLFLGDSYTYHNDMPSMITAMADSAGSSVRYDITVRAFPGANLEDHWNNAETRRLLTQGDWHRIVVQPESYLGRLAADSNHFRFGSRLLRRTPAARPAIVASWTASEAHYATGPVTRSEQLANSQANHQALASRTDADLINVARVWDDVAAQGLPFSLYSDGNHPSLEGSYLAALVIYAELAHTDVQAVTYVPYGMSGDHAVRIRAEVQRSLRTRQIGGFRLDTRSGARDEP